MNLTELRSALRPLLAKHKNMVGHKEIAEFCSSLCLPVPLSEGSKAERILGSFDSLTDTDLPAVAQRFLERHQPSPAERNQIQEVIWAESSLLQITKKVRREVARALEPDDLYLNAERFDELLERLWVLDDGPLSGFLPGSEHSLRAEIDQHVHRNPGDWSVEKLFDRLKVFDASDRRFALFLEGLASSEVNPDEAAQRRFVAKVNIPLNACGLELRETGQEDGYPLFTLVSNGAAPIGSPKNIIFASEVKPDLRFSDAVNNDIEIVTNADKVLVYDRPIGAEGVRWRDLQSWWKEKEEITDDVRAKNTLYQRLKACLPENSLPQRAFFDAYHEGFGKAIPNLPVLLPEVWLHWDPKAARERGPDALLRFRMDFLMLLPHGTRIVIEIDGKHHYARDDGRADAEKYAEMAAADRDLKLSGYEVFRFGTQELRIDGAKETVKAFFESLFKKYRVDFSK